MGDEQTTVASYIAQNFGGRTIWWIWRFTTNMAKFYPPTIFVLAALLCKAANPQMFFVTKCSWATICQSFQLPKFCAIR